MGGEGFMLQDPCKTHYTKIFKAREIFLSAVILLIMRN
jgi:hypothetical protein